MTDKKRKETLVRFNVVIPAELAEQLKKAARKEQGSVSNLVSMLLKRAMKEILF